MFIPFYTYIISYIISMAAVPAFELPKQNGAVVFSGRAARDAEALFCQRGLLFCRRSDMIIYEHPGLWTHLTLWTMDIMDIMGAVTCSGGTAGH